MGFQPIVHLTWWPYRGSRSRLSSHISCSVKCSAQYWSRSHISSVWIDHYVPHIKVWPGQPYETVPIRIRTISNPSNSERKPLWENHQALAVKGEAHSTCSTELNPDCSGQDSNPGHSRERRTHYHSTTKPHTRIGHSHFRWHPHRRRGRPSLSSSCWCRVSWRCAGDAASPPSVSHVIPSSSTSACPWFCGVTQENSLRLNSHW